MRESDTHETGADYNRARNYQTALGLGFAVLGVVALFLGHTNVGVSLVGAGMALVPMRTIRLPTISSR